MATTPSAKVASRASSSLRVGSSYTSPLVIDDDSPPSRRIFVKSNRQRKKKKQKVELITLDDEDDAKMPAVEPNENGTTANMAISIETDESVAYGGRASLSGDAAFAASLQETEWAAISQNGQLCAPSNKTAASVDDDDDRKIAARDGDAVDDAAFAASLQKEEWATRARDKRKTEEEDASLAASIQDEETAEMEMRKKGEKEDMNGSVDGRAWLFVNEVLDLHRRLASTSSGNTAITTVAVDDMVFLAKAFIQKQLDFKAQGIPDNVTLAYHYTKQQYMESIKENGLMTIADRKQTRSGPSTGGAYFGEGVYTGRNPFAFHAFNGGDVGLIVAVLMGKSKRVGPVAASSAPAQDAQTVIGNKVRPNTTRDSPYDEIVLQTSCQCLPLLQFQASLVSRTDDNCPGNDWVWTHHEQLQKVLDKSFNGGVETKLKRVLPSKTAALVGPPMPLPPGGLPMPLLGAPSMHMPAGSILRGARAARSVRGRQIGPGAVASLVGAVPAGPPPALTGLLASSVPTGLPPPMAPVVPRARQLHGPTPGPSGGSAGIHYQAPTSLPTVASADTFQNLGTSCSSKEDCAICMQPLCSPQHVVRIKACLHEYHSTCIKAAMRTRSTCPICRKQIHEPQGHSPSGTMTVETTRVTCSGFESCGQSILITYTMSSGTQMAYHENPGQPYTGTKRQAYLPSNEDGKKLLKRLKYAFRKGLTFSIGTSLTTGQPNCVVWSSIHHKTSPSGGPTAHGFPDPGFFANCNEELDSAGVPPSDSCP